MTITAEEYEAKTGYAPVDDDLERVNCTEAGRSHMYCGWCKKHDRPRFSCGCLFTTKLDGDKNNKIDELEQALQFARHALSCSEQQILDEKRNLVELIRNFCGALNKDSSMNEEAFGFLCALAVQATSTQYSWFSEEHARSALELKTGGRDD